jgi:hypothetical protein
MSDTKTFESWSGEKKPKKRANKSQKGIDMYRKVLHNVVCGTEDDVDNAFDEYLDYEFRHTKSKIR